MIKYKISIVSATYNAEHCLDTMIRSVITQKVNDVQFLIIDGGSKDSTVEIINSYNEHIDFWISEPDKGIYDAWNKGIKHSNAEWIMFLGSDDILTDGAISTYLEYVNSDSCQKNLEYISSKVQMIDKNGSSIWVNGEAWTWPKFQYKMTVAHPGSLHNISLFEKYGVYNMEYKIVGDYELLLRSRQNLKTAFINKVTVKMTEGGISDSLAGIREYYKAVTKTGGSSKAKSFLTAVYILSKTKINKFARKIGLNLNKKR